MTTEIAEKALPATGGSVGQVRVVPNWSTVRVTIEQHLGRICRELREGSNPKVELYEVTHLAKLSEASLSNFETGKSRPRDLARVIKAYATVLDIPWEDIWVKALRAWNKEFGKGGKQEAA